MFAERIPVPTKKHLRNHPAPKRKESQPGIRLDKGDPISDSESDEEESKWNLQFYNRDGEREAVQAPPDPNLAVPEGSMDLSVRGSVEGGPPPGEGNPEAPATPGTRSELVALPEQIPETPRNLSRLQWDEEVTLGVGPPPPELAESRRNTLAGGKSERVRSILKDSPVSESNPNEGIGAAPAPSQDTGNPPGETQRKKRQPNAASGPPRRTTRPPKPTKKAEGFWDQVNKKRKK